MMIYFSYTEERNGGNWSRWFGRYNEDEGGAAEIYKVLHMNDGKLSYELYHIYLTAENLDAIEKSFGNYRLMTQEEYVKVMEQLTAYNEERNMADERLRDLLK